MFFLGLKKISCAWTRCLSLKWSLNIILCCAPWIFVNDLKRFPGHERCLHSMHRVSNMYFRFPIDMRCALWLCVEWPFMRLCANVHSIQIGWSLWVCVVFAWKKNQTYRVCFSEKLVGLGSRSSDACVDFCLIPGFASNLKRVSIWMDMLAVSLRWMPLYADIYMIVWRM